MSRYSFREGRFEFTVGWDPKLETFFGIIEDLGKGEDENPFIVWVGTRQKKYSNLKQFLNMFQAHAASWNLIISYTEKLITALRLDQKTEHGAPVQ